MEERLSPKDKKELKRRMMEALQNNISPLSEELQQILIDDLVTAFQNRMLVFARIQRKKGITTEMTRRNFTLNP